MFRETSIEVYNQLKSEGALSRLRWIVYDHIFHNGPVTQRQAVLKLSNRMESNGTFSSRFSELEKIGLLQILGKVVCEFTGRKVYQWDVTNKLPIKLEKEKRIKCPHCDGRGYFKE